MSEKSVGYIAGTVKIGLFILPVLSLMVAGNFFAEVFLPGSGDLFFPFITAKNFFFRFAVEILFFLWVLAAVFDKKYRPKKSPLLFILTLLMFILILSAIFGENPYRSFWSNYERMEGLIGHIHLYLYFLILISVFDKRKDWKRLFVSMLGASFIAVIYAILQYFGNLEVHQGGARLDATFGNATYLAIFLIFHMFLIALFMYWYRNLWLRIGLGALFLLEFYIMFLTATRGAILGFFGGMVIFLVLTAIFSKKKKIRYGLISAVLLFFVLVALFVSFKNLPFIKNHPVLSRFASISVTETTTESRLNIWKMSWEAFQEHPVLGWGPENYNLVFNKYFKPILWKQEPWFDRSHNIVFDWLISAGILGFLAYLSIFAAAIYMLWRAFRKGFAAHFELVLAAALFAAYFFHNIFVFDNLTSYYMFFTVLAFIHGIGVSSEENAEQKGIQKQKKRMDGAEMSPWGYFAITFAFLAVIFSFYFINLKPLLANKSLIGALYLTRQGQPVDKVMGEFERIFSYGTFGDGEAREQLAQYANELFNIQNAPDKDKTKALEKAVSEMEKQIELSNNKDIRYLLFTAPLYIKLNKSEEALKVINRALELSPKKQQIYFMAADVYINLNQMDKAVEMVKIAYELDTANAEAAKNLAVLYVLQGKQQESEALLLEHYGGEIIADARLLNAYAQVGDFETVKKIWLMLIEENPDNPQYRVSLAATYLKLGEKDKAIEELQKAGELNPEFKEQADQYIEAILNGQL